MRIRAAGLDFTNTPVAVRERFSFTGAAAADFLAGIKRRGGDAVLLSTCNRIVLWTCGELAPAELLRAERGEAPFFSLDEAAAIRHLYEVAAGLRSQAPLEDQILGQLKNALEQARNAGACGAVLDHLFLGAISAGKEIRAKLGKSAGTASTAQLAVDKCLDETGGLEGKTALVVGSGEMGMLCARLLLERGARVMMTRRKPRNDGVAAPAGTELIPYEKRYEAMRGCDVVMSATACPRVVLRAEDFEPAYRDLVIFDLAVPRDVAPEAGQISGVKLFDMDSLGRGAIAAEMKPAIERIIRRHMERFNEWASLRACKHFFDDIHAYFEREFSCELGPDDDPEKIKTTVRRVTDKLLFTLKDQIGREKAAELYAALAEAARG